ncbi:alpha-L-fucosidase C-terminal domain-containing protein [Chitinophaga sancti]|uniref:Alpha-L-fucosidase C-terminal domain-containing protein n=3 Tax=Chitinophaga sancti TaxID=1004 RepID=A0ABZ0XHV3_9BACT|nr:alpha-L-fucosidase C-terminal domain-containing protein [Chitinophaga sancti]WQG90233.1 alpha-L-fucosidase C-terminal domain-containing protein [Chitinophaga sancti]
MVDGKLKMLPGGGLGSRQAEFRFDSSDFRFTVGKNNALYIFSLVLPKQGTQLVIKSLATDAGYFKQRIKRVSLLGYSKSVKWKQDADGLKIFYPQNKIPFSTSVVFKIE